MTMESSISFLVRYWGPPHCTIDQRLVSDKLVFVRKQVSAKALVINIPIGPNSVMNNHLEPGHSLDNSIWYLLLWPDKGCGTPTFSITGDQ